MKRILILLFGLVALPGLATTTVPEPETIFYGKVLNRSGPTPYQMSAGTIRWTIRVSDTESLEFEADLLPLADGAYSYRLAIPHSALALDLESDPDSVPLGAVASTYEHIGITVNGYPATIAEPGSYLFDVSQATRASTYRLDLDVSFQLPDSDGDGMPDWWEDEHGLDKQLADGADDPDGDGVGNLAEYQAGTDPNLDGRIPQLVTTEVSISAAGLSGVYLKTVDEDTPAASVMYTMTQTPAVGTLYLRDVNQDLAQSDLVVLVGSSFSQQAVNEGRLVYQAPAGGMDPGVSFGVVVSDGDAGHEPASATIGISSYNADTAALDGFDAGQRVAMALSPVPLPGIPTSADLRARRFILARDGGFVAWNLTGLLSGVSLAAPSSGGNPGSYSLSFGPDLPAWISGGSGNDFLRGGIAADVIAGGPGDDRLEGGFGGDIFLFSGTNGGTDTVVDFNLAQRDKLDVSRLLGGSSSRLDAYLSVVPAADDLVVGVDANGDGSGFNDHAIVLQGAAATGATLRTLWNGGHLLTNGLSLPPRVELGAATVHASENGPTPASFTLSLDAPAPQDLVLQLLISGSATNGSDYQTISTSQTIRAGETSLEIVVRPYADAISEPGEVVAISLTSGSGYELGASVSGEIIIDDLMPEITIEALEPVAFKDIGAPGAFLIRRSGIIDRSVLVRLEVKGTATNGNDYGFIANYLNLSSGQTSAVVEVVPLAGGALQFGTESVNLRIKPDPAYRTGSPDRAQVHLVESQSEFGEWVDASYPEASVGDLAIFAGQHPAGGAMEHLLLYAFDLSAAAPYTDADHLPRARIIEGHLAIEFVRRPGALDLSYIVETATSTGAGAWSSAPAEIEDISATLSTPDGRRALFRATAPIETTPHRFMRVRVIYQP